ncbi:hypothetical protein AVEN_158112-1 [Araneus ventricosus]|uniref:Mos1 transposase HTH domain-containing protein n=1 Tax=Araneus ventricosus TaxID=182803 RepID=A0A4Y2GR54_ARAVE|nr:hypothetical protein AVEN_158112-1 [Araneus ventricosus]
MYSVVAFFVTEKADQKICFKFCRKLGDTRAETYDKLKRAYGEYCMNRTRFHELFKSFQHGRENIESDKHSKTLTNIETSTLYVQLCLKIIESVFSSYLKSTVLAILELSEEYSISYSRVI